MDASYYIKGQPPNAALYEIHTAGIKFTDEDLKHDYPFIERMPARERAVFILANAALVAAVEAHRFGLITPVEATFTTKKARDQIDSLKEKYDSGTS